MPVLGIDTSCYTTSVALVEGAALLREERAPLGVPEGGRGLMQSNALFQHVQNLPGLIEALDLKSNAPGAVAVSARPRPAAGSYMPVFTAGLCVARSLAAALGAPLIQTSHQEGHIAAGCFSIGFRPAKPFLAFHISGGTTELLRAEPEPDGFSLELLGATRDLHAGQVVDRVGVALGLKFPAGPALEKLALGYGGKPGALPIRANVSGMDCSLSGAESAAQRCIAAGADAAAVAYEVQRCLAGVFTAMAQAAVDGTGIKELLVIGGVASNESIRGRMREALEKQGVTVLFAAHPFSADNAVGVAAIGQQVLSRQECAFDG
jgi:N6-L-threonylcarbamoyladenine synthase